MPSQDDIYKRGQRHYLSEAWLFRQQITRIAPNQYNPDETEIWLADGDGDEEWRITLRAPIQIFDGCPFWICKCGALSDEFCECEPVKE